MEMNKVERLFKIIDYLSARNFVTAEELANATNTSKRNIYRDIRELERVGYYFHSEKKGYLLLEKPIKHNVDLTEREMLSILITQALPKQNLNLETSMQTEYKISRNKTSKEKRWNQVISERILHHFLYRDTYDKNFIIALVDAMEKRKRVIIVYYSPANSAETNRIIDPYYLVDRDDHYYVVAYCNTKKEFRNFRIDRIKSWQVEKQIYPLQEEFSITRHLANWKMDNTDEINKFVVRFSNKVGKYIKEKKFYDKNVKIEEMEDGTVLLTIETMSKLFLRWVRKYGIDAEVLEPIHIRDQLKNEYRKLLDIYDK